MDIWVERTSDNYQKIKLAFNGFGMPVFDMNEENFLTHPNWDVFTYGVPPSAIDVMVKVKGLIFQEAYENAVIFEDDDMKIRTIHITDLLKTKRESGRLKDLYDIQNLTKSKD
jgi:hypothetical protein